MSGFLEQIFSPEKSIQLNAEELLFSIEKPVRSMFFVRSGEIQLRRYTRSGNTLILQNATQGAVVAEASAYSSAYHCDAMATKATELLYVSKLSFIQRLHTDPTASRLWSKMLAQSVQSARIRAEIRSLSRVCDRLDAWLEAGNKLPSKGQWQEVAFELGVSREAFYREMSKRKLFLS